jgi:carboxylate-amine ligase
VDLPTLGIEEEFLLADARTGQLRQDSEEVLRRARHLVHDGLEHELRTGMIETGTAVCRDLSMARAEVQRRRWALSAAAAGVGARVLASGSHPGVSPEDAGYADDARYRQMAREFGPIADETLVGGCHVHVSVRDRDSGVAVLDLIRAWLPVLVAVSVNSPMWRGRDTGFDSWRTQVLSRWPTAGPTSPFRDMASYDARADTFIESGAALDRGMLYYQARLSERWPTVEVRVADTCLDVGTVVLLGALTRALVMTAGAGVGSLPPDVPVEVLGAATFAASRFGLRKRLMDPLDGRARPAADVVDRLLIHVRDALEEAGDNELVVEEVSRLRRDGTGADRQRAAWQHDGMAAVLRLVAVP